MDWIDDVNWLMFWTGWAIFVGVVLLVARGFYRAGYRDAMNEVDRWAESRLKEKDSTFERVVVSHEPAEEAEWCDGQVDPMTECTLPKDHTPPCENANIL